MFVAKSGERLVVLDDRNQVTKVDMGTGEMVALASLSRGVQVNFWAAGRAVAYALDSSAGELYVVDLLTLEHVSPNALNFLKPVSSIAVGLDDRLWIGLKDAGYLLEFDPVTRKMASYDLGIARISALAVDAAGRILYVDDNRSTVGTYDPRTANLNEVTFARRGTTTGLVVDRNSTLWFSTSAGEIFWVRGSTATLAIGLQRPVTTLALDLAGRAWYLAPLPTGAVGFGYAAADTGAGGQTIAGPASSLAFSALGRAWLADPQGGFYVGRVQP
jgi:streptogramin lyase